MGSPHLCLLFSISLLTIVVVFIIIIIIIKK